MRQMTVRNIVTPAYIEPGLEGMLGYKKICSQVTSIDYIDKSYSNRMNHADRPNRVFN